MLNRSLPVGILPRGTAVTAEASPLVTRLWPMILAVSAVGFGALGYPWTLNTVLWGLAMGAAAVVATLAASGVLGRLRVSGGWLRLPLAFGTAFVVYEMVIMAVSFILGRGNVFAPALLGRLALLDAAWLSGLMLVHVALAARFRPWRGLTSRLARTSCPTFTVSHGPRGTRRTDERV